MIGRRKKHENDQPVRTVKFRFFREESAYESYKEQLGERLNSKEPTEAVQSAELAFSPLDEQLCLQPGSLTPLQLSYLTHFASFHSFDQAAQMLKQHHGVQVSASTSRRQTEDIGAAAEKVQDEQARAQLKQKNSDSEKDSVTKEDVKQVMSSDGAYISLRGKVKAEVKTMIIGEVKENICHSKQRPDQEVKMVNILHFSRMTQVETFTELVTGETARRGFLQAEQVCAIQDGAEWIQNVIDAQRADAVRILDFYHAAEYLSEIAALVRAAGTNLAENWLEEQLHELKHQGPGKVLEEVGRFLPIHPDIEDLEKNVNYLRKREQMMQYPFFQRQGWPIGSGSVESANKCVVQVRLCGPGMHWERRNVNPMLALRTSICNDQWDATRKQAFQQRLLMRRSRRFIRSAARYEEIEKNLKKTLIRLFFLFHSFKPKNKPILPSSDQAEIIAPSSGISDESPQASHPVKSHPWRRYPRAKK